MLTKHVQLPSKGFYYPRDHPQCNKPTIEVKLFTAKEQDILTDQALARTGTTIDVLLESIIIDKNIKARTLLSGDRTAILMKSRQYSLGAGYPFEWKCSCGQDNTQTADLSKMPYKASPKQQRQPRFKIVLPTTGKMVEYKLLAGSDEQAIRVIQMNRKRGKLPPAMVTTRLRQMIVSIDGDLDAGKIRAFVRQMPATDTRRIRSDYAKNNPDIDVQLKLVCSKCGRQKKMMLPISASFFRSEE